MKMVFSTIATILLLSFLMSFHEVIVSSYQPNPFSRRITRQSRIGHPFNCNRSTFKNTLQTNATKKLKFSLNDVPDISPMERVMLTREGSLQHLISAYYDEKVNVKVDRSDRIYSLDSVLPDLIRYQYPVEKSKVLATWDRRVTMSIMSHSFCKASSVVQAHSLEVVDLLGDQSIGIGQLFEVLDVRSRFMLHDAGRNEDGGLWRIYSLHCDGLVTCNIREDFSPEVCTWSIKSSSE